jgi:integrase/recombinase XerD
VPVKWTSAQTLRVLRIFFGWCAERRLEPLAAARVHVELYVRWMQEIHRLKPSTVSR